MEEGLELSVLSQVTCAASLRGDTSPLVSLLASAHSAPGGWWVGLAELMNPDIFQKFFV